MSRPMESLNEEQLDTSSDPPLPPHAATEAAVTPLIGVNSETVELADSACESEFSHSPSIEHVPEPEPEPQPESDQEERNKDKTESLPPEEDKGSCGTSGEEAMCDQEKQSPTLQEESVVCREEDMEEKKLEIDHEDQKDGTTVDGRRTSNEFPISSNDEVSVKRDIAFEDGTSSDTREVSVPSDMPVELKLEDETNVVEAENIGGNKELKMENPSDDIDNDEGAKEGDMVKKERNEMVVVSTQVDFDDEIRCGKESTVLDVGEKNILRHTDQGLANESAFSDREMEYESVSAEEEEVGVDESQRLEETSFVEIEEGNRKLENEFSAEGEDVEMEERGDDLGEMEVNEEQEQVDADEMDGVNRAINGKRKRGKGGGKTNIRTPLKKKIEEDVCFICFDGGDLVLCDRRGCPKAYHPSCVNHDEAFFQTKGRWNCGWHQCSFCQKSASHYTCFTCTFSLCKVCIKDAVIFCVRGNKGLCETCIRTVLLIEHNDLEINETAQVDFDDKSSWEYLFKDYWIDLKKRESITSEELSRARNPWKGSDSVVAKPECSDDFNDANNGGSGSESSMGKIDMNKPKKKGKKRLKSRTKLKDSPKSKTVNRLKQGTSDDSVEWASKELLELVMHMRNGDKSICSQFDVQALLLEYITRNKLRDPRRKSQIICDARLQNLFGKPRVGHFEMLKLLESHFLVKEDSQADDLQGSVVDTETTQLEVDDNSESLVKTSKEKKRKSSKKGDGRGMQSNVDDYAAIDMHNITLIYLRRSLVEFLLNDVETFNEKVVGAFVRLRIPGSTQKQDLYRLVQVVGTSKTAEPYRVGKKTTEFLLEILNLNKSEIVSIDIISNQEFTEDECKRLRQSVKCGLISPLTVGAIQEKAVALQAVRVQDSLEAEITRVSHLRDRASDMGLRKELRECVEKLSRLKSHEERQRRLDELPEIRSDPKMDPGYESEDDEDNFDDRRQESYAKPRSGSFNRRTTELISPRTGGVASTDVWGGSRNFSGLNRDLSRSMSGKSFYNKGDGMISVDVASENSLAMIRDREVQQQSLSWEKPKGVIGSDLLVSKSVGIPDMASKVPQDDMHAPPSVPVIPSDDKINKSEKMWHYKDPSGKIQGPFSMVQLRKWSTTGYFPADLKIWRKGLSQDNSVLLTDALNGILPRDLSPIAEIHPPSRAHLSLNSAGHAGDTDRPNPDGLSSQTSVGAPKNGIGANLPSPTPSGSTAQTGVLRKDRSFKSRWSPTKSDVPSTNSLSGHIEVRQAGGSGDLPTPTPRVDFNQYEASMVSKPSGSLSSQLQGPPNASVSSATPAFDVKSFHSLVKQVTNSPSVGSHGWMATTVSQPEASITQSVPSDNAQPWIPQKAEASSSVPVPLQPNPYSSWGNTANPVQNTASYTGATSSGPPTIPAAPSSSWRAPVQGQINQPTHSSVQWDAGNNGTQSSGPRGVEVHSNAPAWGALPGNSNAGWVHPPPPAQNSSWIAPGHGPAPGNGTPGWAPAPIHSQPSGWGTAPQGQGYGNTYQGWMQPGQGPPPVAASGWMAPGQRPPAGNVNPNPGWSGMPPAGNAGPWPGDRDRNGTGVVNHRDIDRDRSWNRPPLNREDSSRLLNKGNRVCKYHESGHCKKGSACDYLHS